MLSFREGVDHEVDSFLVARPSDRERMDGATGDSYHRHRR